MHDTTCEEPNRKLKQIFGINEYIQQTLFIFTRNETTKDKQSRTILNDAKKKNLINHNLIEQSILRIKYKRNLSINNHPKLLIRDM